MNIVTRIWPLAALAVLAAAGLVPVLYIPSMAFQPSTTAAACDNSSNTLTVLDRYSTYTDTLGHWHIVGVVCNNSRISYEAAILTTDYLSVKGETLETTTNSLAGYGSSMPLPAGESRCFNAAVSVRPYGFTDLKFASVTALRQGKADKPYSVTDVTFDGAALTLYGRIRNLGTDQPLRAYALLRDRSGVPLGCADAWINRSEPGIGESTSFLVQFDQHPGISTDPQVTAGYTYTIWADTFVADVATMPTSAPAPTNPAPPANR